MNAQQLDGKVAYITGAASGVGAATARRLVAAGAKVVVADVDESNGKAVAASIGNNAVFMMLIPRHKFYFYLSIGRKP